MRILAHRGSPTTPLLENTLLAVTACLVEGADGVEVDLRLSADGVLVVCHDPDLLRLTGRSAEVATTGWHELRDAAAPLPLARLEEVLVALAGRPAVLELKAPPPASGAVVRTAEAVVDRLAFLTATGLPLDVTVSSFSPAVVAAVRAQAPPVLGVRTALLGRPGVRVGTVLRQALAAGHDEIHPHVGALLAEPGCVAAAHRCGLAVVPWTVNRRRLIRRLASLGVDALITDIPSKARAEVVSRGPRLASLR